MIPWAESSSLSPAGPQAGTIASVWWFFFSITAAAYFAVLVTLVLALTRAEGTSNQRRRTRVIASATGLTFVLLLALLAKSVLAGKSLSVFGPGDGQPLAVRITGRQWWWQIEYLEDPPSQMVTTANELHIPVGRPVRIELVSRDVIHSFWVPALHGKRDLVPGHPTATWMRADRAGTFRGQCAEFCGVQHANMGLLVIAQPPADFAAWLAHERTLAPEPLTAETRRGREVFLSGPCVLCHAVAGTTAAAANGPDLTHVASRLTLAAGTFPNGRDQLAAWIRGAQARKPGCHMPSLSLAADDERALLAYLETLR